MDEIKSPCNNNCRYDYVKNYCLGCLRTMDEIIRWRALTNSEKQLVLQEAKKRKGITMAQLAKGFIQVYTGNGKGKTTAAIGLAVRAAGAGLKTYIIQFMKEYTYSEIKSLEVYRNLITIEQCCSDDFVLRKELPSEAEVNKARAGLKRAKEKMLSGEFDIIVLDEVLVSIYFKLFTADEIIEFIGCKPGGVELVLTGRYCPQEIIDKADLVTEMKEIKHYYTKGVTSRKGIES